jgi:2-polyprenyl-3-methyl-5-hydroxy-6-metoxy-1,4-benzoquinol methylase
MDNKHFLTSPNMIIEQSWPEQDLEYVNSCPLCGCEDHSLAYSEVKDWAFSCAPGKWNYWHCNGCKSLYLNPRPTKNSIGRAYDKYYTHTQTTISSSYFYEFKTKLRNECLFHWLGIDAHERFNLQSAFYLNIFKPFIDRKFPLDALKNHKPGSLLDVGCGNGDLMQLAKAMGYSVHGLEIDPVAAKIASDAGLLVRQGSFDLLSEYQGHFDYIVCSHVLEHVHDPCQLIELLVNAAKPGGRIFITWPNPESYILKLFGRYWRGLEAPRHLSLLSHQEFLNILSRYTTCDVESFTSKIQTIGTSWRLFSNKGNIAIKYIDKLAYLLSSFLPKMKCQDFLLFSFCTPSDKSKKNLNPLEIFPNSSSLS